MTRGSARQDGGRMAWAARFACLVAIASAVGAARAARADDPPFSLCDVRGCEWPQSYIADGGRFIDPYDQFFRYRESIPGAAAGPVNDGSLGLLAGEGIDLFTGSLSLLREDVFLPGKAGLDLSIVRSYSSKLWGRADVPASAEQLALFHEGLQHDAPGLTSLGMGWSMHMGRLLWPVYELPTYESPSGEYRRFVPSASGQYLVSRDLWRLWFCDSTASSFCMWSDTGTRYEFGSFVNGDAGTNIGQVTRIVDPFGNAIQIYYRSDGAIDDIIDTYGRHLTFHYDDDGNGPRLNSITSGSPNIGYSYQYSSHTCESCGSDGGAQPHRFLTRALPLAGPPEEYAYAWDAPVPNNKYALQQVTYPGRGYVTYSYQPVSFFVGLHVVPFSVISQRTVFTNAADVVGRQWSYSYASPLPGGTTPDPWSTFDPSKTGTDMNVTTVTRPDGVTDSYSFYGFGWVIDQAQANARGGQTYLVGLPYEIVLAGGAHAERFEWRVGPAEQATSTNTQTTLYGPGNYDYYDDPARCAWWTAAPGTTLPVWCYLWDPRTITPVLLQHDIIVGNGVYSTGFEGYDAYNQPATVIERGVQAGFSDGDNAPQYRKTCYRYYSQALDGSGGTLNMVHGRPLTQDVCLGESCDCAGAGAVHRQWSYGSRGELATSTVSGVTTGYEYDSSGNLSVVSDAAGNSIQYLGFTNGLPTETVQNGLVHTHQDVSWEGWIGSVTDARGNVTSYIYDAAGRLTQVNPPGAPDKNVPWIITYDDANYDEEVVVSHGSYWRMELRDGLGRLEVTGNSEGTLTSQRYEHPMGWLTFSSYPFDARGGEVGDKYERDVLGRTVIRTKAYRPATSVCDTPGACMERTDYEYANCALTSQDRGGGQVTWSARCYRSFGSPSERQLSGAEDGAGSIWSYPRDAGGKMTGLVAPAVAGDRSYHYDSHEFLSDDGTGESGPNHYGWNAIGLPLTKLDAAGVTKSYGYDALSRVASITYQDAAGAVASGESVGIGYDDSNNVTLVSSPNGGALSFHYDELNRVVEQDWTAVPGGGQGSIPSAYQATYHYDKWGCLYDATYPTGTHLTITCDPENRPTSISDENGPLVTSVTYHPSGRPSEVDLGNGETVAVTYDDRARAKSITAGSTVLTYGYDGNDNVVTLSNSLAPDHDRAMVYDSADRLIWAATTATGLFGASYGYDALGNRSERDLLSGASTTYTYDGSNRLASMSGEWVAPLDLTFGVTGKLSSANGDTYQHDGLGRRVMRSSTNGVVLYHYDPAGRVIAETRGDGTFESFIYLGSKLIAVVGCISPGVTVCTERQWYHTDDLGSVVARTDQNGLLIEQVDYQPNGELWTHRGSPGDRQYNGRVYDPGTGFHDYGARMYWPQIGRFISADSYQGDIGNPASLNRYSYVLNNPYRYTDPTGHQSAEGEAEVETPEVEAARVANPGVNPANVPRALPAEYADLLMQMQNARPGYSIIRDPGWVPTKADVIELAGEVGRAQAENARGRPGVGEPGGPKAGSEGGPGAGRRFPGSVKDAAEEEAGGKCVFCGRDTTREPGPGRRNTDHAIPKSRGGNNTRDNAQNTCQTCNLQKGTKTTQEHLEDR